MSGKHPGVLVHATAVELRCGQDIAGVLLTGPAGSGKSSLALALVDQPGLGLCANGPLITRLVSDDQVSLIRTGPDIVMSAPDSLAGLLEVRGMGIVQLREVCPPARLSFVVEHQPAGQQERLPQAAATSLLGQQVPVFQADLAAPAAASRIRVLAQLHWGQLQLVD
jgi:serine kinase of HPr protein (carbohydrate metabolism regulator)